MLKFFYFNAKNLFLLILLPSKKQTHEKFISLNAQRSTKPI